MRTLVLLLVAVAASACSAIPNVDIDGATFGLTGGRFESLDLRGAAGTPSPVDGDLGVTLDASARTRLTSGSRLSPLKAGIQGDLGLGLTKEAFFLLAVLGARATPPRNASSDVVEVERNSLLLSNLSVGPYASYELFDGFRLTAGLAPALLFGSVDVQAATGGRTTGSGWGSGLIGRVGLELVRRNRAAYGLGFQWVEGELDLGSAGPGDLEAWRVALTLSIGF